MVKCHINAFIKIYEESDDVNFATLRLFFPGRNGNQVYNQYRKLLAVGGIKEMQYEDD